VDQGVDRSEHLSSRLGIRFAASVRSDRLASVSPLLERRPSVSPQFGLHDRDDPTQGLRNGVEQTEHLAIVGAVLVAV
jgi:hypothetical protein